MEKQFVPYELAVKLKELGFDEPCFLFYEKSGELKSNGISQIYFPEYIKKGTKACVAPLWQQAFDWFREKHNAYVCFNWHSKGVLNGSDFVFDKEEITCESDINWSYEIDYYGSEFQQPLSGESDAGEFGIDNYYNCQLKCLEKLIELLANTETK